MAVDVAAYAQELMTEAGISDAEQTKQLNAFFTNDKVRGKLTGLLEGIDREKGRTAGEKARADKAAADAQAYYQQQLKLANDNKAVVDSVNAQLQAYVSLYGALPDGTVPTPQNVQRVAEGMIDKKTFDDRMNQTETNTLGLLTTAMKLMDQHRREFPNDPFDVDSLVKLAGEKKLSAAQAYSEMMQPKRDAAREAQEKARIQAAVDAALTEERSKRGATQLSDAAPKSEFMTNWKRQQQPSSAQESFIKGWREPNPGAVSKTEFGRT